MKRSKTSKSWMNEHVSDPYVHQAKLAGYRSRAAFKLLEANDKFNFLTKHMSVVDLGSAPGSWSQVLSNTLGSNGHIFALDLLEMELIKNVDFLKGDFREQEILDIYAEDNPKARLACQVNMTCSVHIRPLEE